MAEVGKSDGRTEKPDGRTEFTKSIPIRLLTLFLFLLRSKSARIKMCTSKLTDDNSVDSGKRATAR